MSLFLFLLFFLACTSAGATGAMFPPGEWYKTLNKPSWTPPDWVFPVAWTSIYILISIAGARAASMNGSGVALAFWACQGAFSTLWTPIFFGLRRLKGALLVMAPLFVSVLGATIAMFQLDFWSGLFFLPYLTWVTIAAMLNYTMAQLNPMAKPLNLSKL